MLWHTFLKEFFLFNLGGLFESTFWLHFGISGITSDPNHVWPDFETHRNIKQIWRLTVWKMSCWIIELLNQTSLTASLSPRANHRSWRGAGMMTEPENSFAPWRCQSTACKSKWMDTSNYCSETKRQMCRLWASSHLHFSGSDVSVYPSSLYIPAGGADVLILMSLTSQEQYTIHYYSLIELPTMCVWPGLH